MSVESQKEERFEKMVTVMIASVAIWVAITAYFQNYASNLSDGARRRAQENSIAATKKEVTGSIQFSYEWQGAYQTYSEIGWQIVAAQQNGDEAAVERYTKLQDKIVFLSQMMQPEYFSKSNGFPDTYKFESDTYLVESTRLSETYLAEADLGNVTDNTADALTVQITLLTVTLSLYGLSMALSGRVRWLFVTVGSSIVVFCMLWLGWSMLELWIRPEVNSQAINAYAEGIGLSYQGRHDDAIEKFTEAIEADPYYGKAYYERGLSYYSMDDLETAITEIEFARSNGYDDSNVNWNLGWLYYITGRFPQAIETNDRILVDHPEILGMRMNQAISYLAMGDIPNAQEQYDFLMAEARNQVNEARAKGEEPSASLWYYMDAGAIDLQNLIDTLDDNTKQWTAAPPQNTISGDKKAIRQFAEQQMIRIKESVVALEYTGELPTATEVMSTSKFTIGRVTDTDADGFITGFEPAENSIIPFGDNSFTVEFTYTGPAPNQIVWKIYVNGFEDQSLRSVSNEDISNGDTWYRTFGYDYTNVFILAQGEYVVELYADNRLVNRAYFTVQ